MKLDLLLTKRRTLIPATPDDAERLRSVPSDSLLPVQVKLIRNGDHHRFFMAVVSLVADNHPRYSSKKQLLRELKYRTHHFQEYVTASGTVLYEMLSISFNQMDEGAFTEWSNRALDVLFRDMWPEAERGEISDEARRQMAEWERSR